MTSKQQRTAKKVYRYLAERPHLHEQENWISGGDLYYDVQETDPDAKPDKTDVKEVNLCGTTMCIAGATMFLEQGKVGLAKFFHDDDDAIGEAGKMLGLSHSDAHDLFHTFDNEQALLALKNLAEGDDLWAGVEMDPDL